MNVVEINEWTDEIHTHRKWFWTHQLICWSQILLHRNQSSNSNLVWLSLMFESQFSYSKTLWINKFHSIEPSKLQTSKWTLVQNYISQLDIWVRTRWCENGQFKLRHIFIIRIIQDNDLVWFWTIWHLKVYILNLETVPHSFWEWLKWQSFLIFDSLNFSELKTISPNPSFYLATLNVLLYMFIIMIQILSS